MIVVTIEAPAVPEKRPGAFVASFCTLSGSVAAPFAPLLSAVGLLPHLSMDLDPAVHNTCVLSKLMVVLS